MTLERLARTGISDTWGDAASMTLGRRHSAMYSLFLYLQDTDETMGPTGFCPGTHMCSQSYEDCPCFFATPKAGTGVILNSQIVHQGSENTAFLKQDGTRVMFIITFASRPRPGTEHPDLFGDIIDLGETTFVDNNLPAGCLGSLSALLVFCMLKRVVTAVYTFQQKQFAFYVMHLRAIPLKGMYKTNTSCVLYAMHSRAIPLKGSTINKTSCVYTQCTHVQPL